ncbi:MAG: sensor histidine kinase [Alloprevotella sp.]
MNVKLRFSHLNWKEERAYLAIWFFIFCVPLALMYFQVIHERSTTLEAWQDVKMSWMDLLVYWGVFLLHNLFLAPLFVYHKKRVAYALGIILLLVPFELYQFSTPPFHERDHRDRIPPARVKDFAPGDILPPFEETDNTHRAEPPVAQEGQKPHHRGHDGKPDRRGKKDGRPPFHRPPFGLLSRDIIPTAVVLLMLALNLGIKTSVRSLADRRKLEELEKQNLEHQIAYLKYQINPHFFMNTLNNIHALVDINPERAKKTIVILSKMMRYLLYDGERPFIPLRKEIESISHYVALMKIRFSDDVKISLEMPTDPPQAEVPPLLFTTFLENAFKHGISLRQPSFIFISLVTDGENIVFRCRNSKNAVTQTSVEESGVGIVNARRRLELLYGNNFTLELQDEADTYSVRLVIPILHPSEP